MRSAVERRLKILEILDRRRPDINMQNLACKFCVSKKTIQRDIEYLSIKYPIRTIPGKGGGIKFMDGYSLYRKQLSNDQAALLRELMIGMPEGKLRIMRSILDTFCYPYKR